MDNFRNGLIVWFGTLRSYAGNSRCVGDGFSAKRG
jgi:hypothetical protein